MGKTFHCNAMTGLYLGSGLRAISGPCTVVPRASHMNGRWVAETPPVAT